MKNWTADARNDQAIAVVFLIIIWSIHFFRLNLYTKIVWNNYSVLKAIIMLTELIL